jgi:hypothetical protein
VREEGRLRLFEKRFLRMFENRFLRMILGTKREEVIAVVEKDT